jgi:hypothetical protein
VHTGEVDSAGFVPEEQAVMHVGGWVSVVPREALEALLSHADGARPEPEQFLYAGRRLQIASAVREADGGWRYRLAGAPGEWRGEWLAPATLLGEDGVR